MTQIEARKRAKKLVVEGIPVIAGGVPLPSWGGKERTWGVYLLVSGQPEILES